MEEVMSNQGLKLLIEQPTFDIDCVVEEKNSNSPSTMYIRGPYLMSETKNRNGRIYKLDEMTREVNRYTNEMIKTNRSIGELNHPTSVEVNPERACHMITELHQEGNIFVGKSKILNSPLGQLVRNLIMDGVKLGVSSRALGKLNPNGDHNDVSDFRFICQDVVHDPSVESAFVEGVYESKSWILKCDGTVCEWVQEEHDKLVKSCNCLPKHDKEVYIKEQVLNFINTLKNNKK